MEQLIQLGLMLFLIFLCLHFRNIVIIVVVIVGVVFFYFSASGAQVE